MNRPWKIWLIFGLCLAILATATGWVSWKTLQLDRGQKELRAQAESEEQARLALWRMDSMLAPLITQEGSRPYFLYQPFYAPDRPYAKAMNTTSENALVPSPLMATVPSNVLFHFQIARDGKLSSPQIPEGQQRTVALSQFLTQERLNAALMRMQAFEQLLNTKPKSNGSSQQSNREILLASAATSVTGDNFLAMNTAPQRSPSQASPQQSPRNKQQLQFDRNAEELQARAQSVQQALEFNSQNGMPNIAPARPDNVFQGVVTPIWLGDALVLARRVVVAGREYTQGCWLDWPGLQHWLLEGVKDILPHATLRPIPLDSQIDPQAHRLAALPVRLDPGPASTSPSETSSPILIALGLVWGCFLLATAAVAVLLHGVIALSERRAMFVSAVSHELRTPLTTFKMYSEMLAENMVPNEDTRREYLATLCSEANRLGHLVENVLAYARLERGSARRRIEELSVAEAMARIEPRLVGRAKLAGLDLGLSINPEAGTITLGTDVTALEQVLFNLVDNACKYGVGGEPVIHLEIPVVESSFVSIRVHDHGPGFSAEAKRNLFKPFGKSAQEAAKGPPGIGLGLALCRRLSRDLGGELRLISSDATGTCFELRLPTLTKG